MKIGLLDADLMDHGTRHPNLALMKLSGYFKEKGNQAALIYRSYLEVCNYDEVYISKVFTFSNIPDWVLEKENVHIGGTGFFTDGGAQLSFAGVGGEWYYSVKLEEILKNQGVPLISSSIKIAVRTAERDENKHFYP